MGGKNAALINVRGGRSSKLEGDRQRHLDLDGLAALLAMLNSCATGISVVNIDNGFGAGYMAALINRLPIYKPE